MPGAILGAVASTVVGGLLSDDNGAEGANDAAADSSRLQAQIARDQWNRYKQNYEPLELSMIDEAKRAGSAAEYAQAAGDASATVSQQFGKARDRLSRTPGLDPSTPGANAAMAGLDMAQAASDATQQNVARQGVKNNAWAKKTGVLGMGKGLDTTAASSLGASSASLSNVAANGFNQANQQAGAVGRIVDRGFNSPTVQGWLGNANRGGAGSMTSNGSVQGNPDYIYDL